MVDPNLSTSVGPPLPERQKWAATVTVTSPTVMQPKAITSKLKGGASVSKDEKSAEMEPLRINVGDTKWVYCCHEEGCTEGTLTS